MIQGATLAKGSGRPTVSGRARDENALLNRRESSNCGGVSVIRSGPTAERERKHVHAVAYGLIHTRKNIGSEAPNAPTNFVSCDARPTRHSTRRALRVAEKRSVPHGGSGSGAGRVGPMAVIVELRDEGGRRARETGEL